MLLHKTVFEIISYLYAVNKTPLVGIKHRIGSLVQIDPHIADLVNQFYTTMNTFKKYELANQMLNQLSIGTTFFEWTSAKSEA